jgi:hypothetical protein
MLNILEKLQFALSGIVILGAIGLYLWQGMDPRPADMIAPVKSAAPSYPKRPPVPIKPGTPATQSPSAPAPTSPDDKALLDRLTREQGLRIPGKELVHDPKIVPKETFEYATREANWKPELNKAASAFLPGADGKMTRLQITGIEEDSLIKKFGLEDGDIVELIDGERVDFQNSTAMQHIDRWKRLQEKIRKGGKIALTITRDGQPRQVEFSL